MVSDVDHHEEVGSVIDIQIGANPWVSYRSAGRERTEVPITNFGMGQLLKFGDLKKSQAKTMDSDEIVDEVGRREVVFKRTDEEILAVVSTEFEDIDANYIQNVIVDTWEANSVSVEDVEVEDGLVTRVWYQLDDEVNGLNPGVHLRNSVFGASALGINRFYTIEDTGARLTLYEKYEYKRYHTGNMDEIRDELEDAARDTVLYMWRDLGKVQDARKRDLDKSTQKDIIREKQSDRKITKEMADELIANIDAENWGYEDDTLWNFIKVICGYATFGDISSQNRKRLERMTESILNMEVQERIPVTN